MIPIVVVRDNIRRDLAQKAIERQEANNDQYPGINSFQQGSGPIYLYYEEQYWIERLMLAMMSASIPFKVEYCERIPDGFTGFRGLHIKYEY